MTATSSSAAEAQTPEVVGHVDNAVVIDAPMDLVWDITNDVEGWPHLFTEYAAAEVLSRDGDTVRFRLSMHPDPQGTVWSWVSERTPDAATRTVAAHRVETGPFEFMDIAWSYEQVAGGVRMRWVQDFRMRPTAPVDTAGMTRRIDANTVVQMDVIRGKVEAAARAVARFAARTAAPAPAPTPAPGDVVAAHQAQAPTAAAIKTVSAREVPANTRRGGDVRTVLAPSTCGSTTGFMGTLALAPGEVVTEHWHPYSEEFLLVTSGSITVRLDGQERVLGDADGVCIPVGVRHRLANDSGTPATAVFTLAPLAPHPRLGHVDTEVAPPARTAAGGASGPGAPA